MTKQGLPEIKVGLTFENPNNININKLKTEQNNKTYIHLNLHRKGFFAKKSNTHF